ncbi:MAG: energy-coupling factor ABC transporter permease [Pseudomonadota bacterium]
MNLPDAIFPSVWLWGFNAVWLILLIHAIRRAPWALFLSVGARQHLFIASCVLLVLLWSMRADVGPGLSIHFFGMAAFTLMFGWPLALIGGSIVMAGYTLLGMAGWSALGLNTLMTAAAPALAAHAMLVLSRRTMAPNFFVYIFVPGFFGAALGVLVSVLLGAFVLVQGGVYDAAHLWHDYLPYLPLIMLPEAVINGMVLTALVAIKPDWVATFDDEVYIRNK